MNNYPILNKKTRILVAAVAILSVFLSVIILFTALNGRDVKKGNPPLSTDGSTDKVTDKAPADTGRVLPKDTERPPLTDKTTEPADSVAASVTNPEDVLPTFMAPVTGAVIKSHTLEVPVYSLTMDDYRTHEGVDIAATAGAPVYAAADGTVTDVWDDPMMGKCLSLSHAGGAVSVYKNLAETLPEGILSGATVKAGSVIAAVGETALIETAESPHLHFELTVNGDPVDPTEFMLIGTKDTGFEG